MVKFQGFKTKEEAQAFVKTHGGYLTFEERTPKRKQLTERGCSYLDAVNYGGLDKDKYPYCVQWNYRAT